MHTIAYQAWKYYIYTVYRCIIYVIFISPTYLVIFPLTKSGTLRLNHEGLGLGPEIIDKLRVACLTISR
jgi:hypothetical protein